MSDIELMPRARPKSAMPIGRPMAMTEPNASSRMTTAATRPISSPMPVAASSNAKNRSPPISIRSGEPAPASAPNALRFSRSPVSSSSSTGYWTRMRATRPSGEIAGSRRCRARCGRRGRPPPGPAARAARASAESRNVAPVVERRHDHLGGQAGLVRAGGREQVGRLPGSRGPAPRRSPRARWPKAPDAPTTSTETTSQDPITPRGGGRRTGPSGTARATSWLFSFRRSVGARRA